MEHAAPPKQQRLEWAVLLAVPLISLVVGLAALPSPKPDDVARASIDRSKLGADVSKTPPQDVERVDVELSGGRIAVYGASLPEAPVSPGATTTIATTFEVRRELDRDWKIFLHVDMRGGRHRVHGDHWPVGGRYPTSSWVSGEFVTDRFELSVPLDAPPGEYEAFLGLYIGDERMPVTGGSRHDGENRVRLGRLSIR